MASLVNGASGTPTPDSASSTVSMSGSIKQSAKPAVNATTKNSDLNRKQANSPSNGTLRANAPPNAWKAGMNPITQRSTNISQQNGASQQSRIGPKPATQGTDSIDKVGNDHLINLLGNAMGYDASVTTKSGDVFSGIFFGVTSDSELSYRLAMVQQTKQAEKMEGVNGVKDVSQDYIGDGEDHTMYFSFKDVLNFTVEGAPTSAVEKQQNGPATGFRTDTDISGNLVPRERELKRWAPSDETSVDMSLEGSNGGRWDQFAANEEKFGLKSDYNEEIYTTSLDRNSAQYRQNEARAARLAREIEGPGSKNSRARDEEEGDEDEEEKYSGVRRHATEYPPLQSVNSNRYMPPARRPPSGQPTVAGAPVDPAIISSQLARQEISPQRSMDPKVNNPGSSSTSAKEAGPLSTDAKQEPAKDPALARPAPVTKDPAPNATANVETEVLNSFRTFAEKQKTKVTDDRQKRARQDKDIKLNDLKGFSKNFKLNTPVPKDLVPILAKDKKKQDEIMEKARREAEQQAVSPSKTSKSAEDSVSRPAGESNRDSTKGMSTDFNQARQQFPPRGPNSRQHTGQYGNQTSPQATGNSGYLAHRLADNQRALKAGLPLTIPTPLPIYPPKPPSRPTASSGAVASSQASSTVRTPTSAASKNFNANALEFKPNPAANTFQPTGPPATNASPRANANPRAPPLMTSPSAFFGTKKAIPSERPSILEHSNPLKRLQEKAEADNKVKDYASNGGIAHAYTTPVTWVVLKDDEAGKSYKDMFNDPPAASTGVSPQPSTSSPMNPNQAHLHQLPAHLQQPGMHQAPIPHHAPYPGPSQPHLYPAVVPGAPHQYEDHRMHGSPSGSAYNTPRMPNTFVPYAPPMGPGMQYPYSQPIPAHMIGPGGPPPPSYRQYANGPQYMPSPGQQLAAPMMVQQGSQGSYMTPQGMGIPHMHMYGPGPNPPYNGPTQPSSGYPSPSRGAPMMMHQGSYQGQPPQMPPGGGQYGQPQPYYAQSQPPHMNPMRGGYPSSPQPHYSQSPQPQYHYPPQQPQRMQSQGYANHSQGPPQHAPTPQGPPPSAPMEGGEAMR